VLSAAQLAKRGEIGASDVPTIVNGSAEDLLEKWRELVGLDPPKDLSRVWRVQKGSHMEPFGLDWHQVTLGYPLEERGEVLRHPQLDFVTCTLDAYDRVRDAVIDFKDTAAPIDWVKEFYAPQVLIQRACRNAKGAIILVSASGRELEEIEVAFDQDYYDEIIARISAFKICIETMTPPVALPKLPPPDQWRTVDLEADEPNYKTEIIEHIMDWRATAVAARVHEKAAESAKSLVPNDVGRLRYQEIRISRSKKGHLSMRSADNEQ
jgi:hypothetical protein